MNASHEFAHLASAGDMSRCEEIFGQIEPRLSRAYDDGLILGYSMDILESDEDCKRELIAPDWKALPGARFPVIYLFVTPLDGFDTLDPSVSADLARLDFVLVRISAPS